MNNHAILLASQGEPGAPEKGYRRAMLTIMSWKDDISIEFVGFRSDTHGELNPTYGFTSLNVQSKHANGTSYKVNCTRPFYFAGVKYQNGISSTSAQALYNAFLNQKNQTVEVWLAPA